MATRSDLTPSEQARVDSLIQEQGVMGIGYYVMRTVCGSCRFPGHTLVKRGEVFVDNDPNLFCVKCGVSGLVEVDD